MSDTPMSGVLPTLLVVAGVLFGLASVGVGLAARRASASRRQLYRYVLLGSALNFLSCISMGAIMLVDISDRGPRLSFLLVLLLACLVWGGIGGLVVLQSVWSFRWWKKHINRLAVDEAKENKRDV